MVAECLESALEIFLEHSRTDDLLSFLTLRTCLSIILAHVLVISGTESDNALFAFVADINSDKHGLLGNL